MRRPVGSVRRAMACAPVIIDTFGDSRAGVVTQTSASLLARTWQGNPSQVLHRMQVPPSRRSMPSGSGNGRRPCRSKLSATSAMTGSCGTAGYGNGVERAASMGSLPAVPWTRNNRSASA